MSEVLQQAMRNPTTLSWIVGRHNTTRSNINNTYKENHYSVYWQKKYLGTTFNEFLGTLIFLFLFFVHKNWIKYRNVLVVEKYLWMNEMIILDLWRYDSN